MGHLPLPSRFYLLDILRGLASLSVVVWHYQHFYFIGFKTLPDGFVRSSQPLYSFLFIFYEHGRQAIALFFVLSGFVFFSKYLRSIEKREVSAREFTILRFSRLYPLHFVTLVFVAAGQYLALTFNGEFIVYEFNNLKHFLLHLFFASNWGFQDGQSFNSPIWSVSIEVLVYALFFILARRIRLTFFRVLALILFGALVWYFLEDKFAYIGLGFSCFFTGGMVFLVYKKLRESSIDPARVFRMTFIFGIMAFLILYFVSALRLEDKQMSLYFALFPSWILFLAVLQDRRITLGRDYRVLGDITYSTYLLHFPLQLLIIGLATYFSLKVPYDSPLCLVAFLSFLIGISIWTYRFFEVPLQKLLRKRLTNA